MAAGLATALRHTDIGGPAPILRAFVPVPNPQAGAIGLVGGLAIGLALGVMSAIVFVRATQATRWPGRRALVVLGAILMVLGVVAWTLPAWFAPISAIDVP